MTTQTLEARVERLESKMQAIEERLAEEARNGPPKKRGWQWFVGINANSPEFEEVVRIGEEWRSADRPKEDTQEFDPKAL